MFDYKLLSALATVVEQGGFERAAQRLGLSQSAVSQRIKLLEMRLGQPVLVRGTPPQPTAIGQRLLNHVQQVRLLEGDLQQQVPALDEDGAVQRLRIALNADSLATWWPAAVAGHCRDSGLLLDLLVEDQAVGLRRMRGGEVAACLCASPRPVAGARARCLGAMRYLALASPAFIDRHLGEGCDGARLAVAPGIVFGPDDSLQQRYLAALGHGGGFFHHLCPSSEGFVRMAEAGLGWGMLPELQVREQLRDGRLRALHPGRHIDVPLYWHAWRLGGEHLERLTGHLQREAPAWLVPVAG